jgi:hypothetical protein
MVRNGYGTKWLAAKHTHSDAGVQVGQTTIYEYSWDTNYRRLT